MRNLKRLSLICIFIALVAFVYSQQDCKVLMPKISDTYVGKCKKGLAHGKGKAVGIDTYEGSFKKGLPNGFGIYTSSTGEIYEGKWKNGLRHGKGKYTCNINNKDSLLVGIWQNDIYIGPKPEKPQIIHEEYIERYTFSRQGEGNRVLINIYQDLSQVNDTEQLSIIGSSGIKTNEEHTICYENVVFPFVCKFSYLAWNRGHIMQHWVLFEFKIKQPGIWRLTTYSYNFSFR